MTISSELIAAAREVEAAEGVAASVLLALAEVETNAQAFATVGDRREPLIRFEGHYFDRRLSGRKQEMARTAGLAHPRAGAVRNPAGQAARWALLERACAIDAGAAYESVSWGLGQVMGAHWRRLGFANAAELAGTARRSATGQFMLVARFLKDGNLHRLLLQGDHAGFARRYNGPAFAQNRYDTKIANAHARALRLLGEERLALGARGERVRALQAALARQGHRLAADGVFGPITQGAVSAFQGANGLPPSGAADGETLRRLGI